MEVSSLTGEATCNISYTTNTNSYTLLSNIVQNNATEISSTSNSGTTDTSYRYNGKNPNNYIWFNNELWRIIGLIPTCTSSGCSTSENLVKIIRNESIGGLAYDAKFSGDTGAWGSNTLYKLLNEYYYGKKDGADSGYCYGYKASAKNQCDYTTKGISSSSTDYYGKMVRNVYWNTGASEYDATASAVYTTETATQTVLGHIGLMSASDFGYAASTTYHSTAMNSYSGAVATDWLYGNSFEWTSVQYSSYSSFALYVHFYGYLTGIGGVLRGLATRPVVYLESSVYVISGDGSESSPYKTGI